MTRKPIAGIKNGLTWRQKLEKPHPGHGKLVPVPPPQRKKLGDGTMLIPRPLDVDAVVRTIRKGRLMTGSELRAVLAKNAGAATTCPLWTGIFLRIVAEAAEEDRRAGHARITPYWRVVKDNGTLNEKFPGGASAHAAQLRAEGFNITSVGRSKSLRVVLAGG